MGFNSGRPRFGYGSCMKLFERFQCSVVERKQKVVL